jgi:ubiquinone/menaquinone biosynthesis C-methylase UbiE
VDRFLTPLLGRLLRWFFRHLYTDLAWSYDLIAWAVSLGQWDAWRACGLAVLPTGRLLEVGHGPGHALVELSSQGRSPIGLDSSPQMGLRAARRLHRAGQPIRLVRAHVQALPFTTGEFDGILSTFPSEYVFDPQALSEFHRVLHADGVLVVVPTARLSAGPVVDRVVDAFFRATGLLADVSASLASRLEASGFAVFTERVELAHSVAQRVICRRRAAGKPSGQALESHSATPWRRM